MKFVHRSLAIFMALILLISIGGCGQKTEESAVFVQAEDYAAQSATQEETAELSIQEESDFSGQLFPSLDNGECILSACVQGEKVYILTRSVDAEAEAVFNRIYSMESDGTEQTLVLSETTTMPGQQYMYSMGIQIFCTCEDGSVWYMKSTSDGQYLTHTSVSGEELANNVCEGVSLLCPLLDGGVAIFGDVLTVVSADGQTRFSIKLDNGWWEDAAVLDDGSVAVLFHDFMSNSYYVKRLDIDNGTLITVSEMTAKNMRLAGGSWDALWLWGGNVSVWEPEVDSVTEKLSFSSEGLIFSDIREVELMSDERLLISEQKMMAEAEGLSLYVLAANNSSSLQNGETTVLRLAGVSIPYSLTEAVLAFNRTNGKYTIEIEDYYNYSTADNYYAGKERLLYEISTGDLPDIIYFGNDLSAEDMASKGYLADIGEFLDADASIDRSELMENVLDAAEIGGMMYTLPMGYYVETVIGRADIIGTSPCTVENVRTWIEQNPTIEAYSEMTRELFLRRLVWANADVLIDSDAGTCRFDSTDFIELLELANKLPNVMQEGVNMSAHNSLFIPNFATTLGSLAGGGYGSAENYEIAGYPGTTDGLTLLRPDPELGISANTTDIDGCWTFLRYLLTREAQEMMVALDGIPIRRDMFDEQVAALRELCADGLFTEAMVEAAAEVASGEGVCLRSNSMLTQLSGIAIEEAEAYFSGNKTAKEAASLIQSRASIYMAEQG